MRGEESFEINGKKFYMERLDPEDSLRGWALVAPVLGTVIDAQAGSLGNISSHLRNSAEQLPGLLKLFVPYVKTQIADGGPERVSLKDTYRSFFKGKPDVLLAMLAHCIMVEYGTFLGGEGMNTVSQAVGSLFTSLSTSAGLSGD